MQFFFFRSFKFYDVFNNEDQSDDIPTLIDRKDNVFIISNPKSKYPILKLDLRLISDLVVVIVSAACGGIAFACAGQPVITGYLLSGSLIGPGGLNFVSEMVQVETVAQFGVIFLLFALGLEFSTAKLRVVRAVAILGGLLQICLFMCLCGIIASGGAGLNKLNSIYDFAACGSHLINEGYVHKDQLCSIGSSAGGLLVGATINMCLDLFRAAILKVPFLDICSTMLDPDLPLTTLDYEEFGDPRHKINFENIRTYSPYDNILSDLCYPSALVTTSFYDSRVGVWEAAKWIARIRERSCPKCSRSIILKTNMSGGHFGEGGRFIHCEEMAFEYAFLIKVMEMNDS